MPEDSKWLGIDDSELQLIAREGSRTLNRSRPEFDDGMRGKTDRNSPWRNFASHLLHLSVAIEIDEIDGEPHEKGMDGLAWDDPKAFFRSQARASEQAFAAFGSIISNFDAAGEDRLTGKIGYLHL